MYYGDAEQLIDPNTPPSLIVKSIAYNNNNDTASIYISGLVGLMATVFLMMVSSLAITNWGNGLQLMSNFTNVNLNGFNSAVLPVTASVSINLAELLLPHRRLRMLFPTLTKIVIPSINKIRFFDKAV